MICKILFIAAVITLSTYTAFPQTTYSQNYLDSIFTEYVKLKEQIKENDFSRPSTLQTEKSKCGLFLINFVKQNIELFTPQQQQLLKKLNGRPSLPKSIITPSGKFRLHYDTTTASKPKYLSSLSIDENLVLAASAIDSVYNFEVNYLEYLAPPSDNGAGGDNLYDVYVLNLGGSLYGYTESESHLSSQKYTSFMVIDNDYAGYYSSGINGARVTLAHEFHHGIQMGNYILRFEDTFFYEITSTSMEEFVYDDVNDYYAYMSSYFLIPQNAFADNDGYNLAIWNLFLKENFGFNILKRQWELMPSQRAMLAINTSIEEANSSFKHELNQFGIWTYFTKHRAVTGKYFEEGSNYPLLRPFTSPNYIVTIYSKPTANNCLLYNNQPNSGDSMFVIITNGDVQRALNNISQTDTIVYYLFGDPKFITKNPQLWSISEILDTIINIIEPQLKTDYPYPMPFSYKTHLAGKINIPVLVENVNTVGLYIFSTAMGLVYSNDEEQIDKLNKNVISWTVKDNQGEKLASGIYLYVVKSGDSVEKGKLVILHD